METSAERGVRKKGERAPSREGELESLATGRVVSLFAEDIEANRASPTERLRGSRIAIVGAAGSIGRAVLESLSSLFSGEPRSARPRRDEARGLREGPNKSRW